MPGQIYSNVRLFPVLPHNAIGKKKPNQISHLDSSIIVSEADLKNVNKTSIPIPGMDDAYWVDLSVTHELHCIVCGSSQQSRV